MRKPPFISVLAWANGAVPGSLIVWDALHDQLGANPVKSALLQTGLLSIVFLVLSLAVTPLRELAGWSALFPARRVLGLWAAIYAFAHVGIFFWWDREHSISSTLHEIATRNYLWFGVTALFILMPLTLTSTAGMVKRLGSKNWKRLHRLVYLAAIAAAVHFLLQGKYVSNNAILVAAAICALLAYRFYNSLLAPRPAARRSTVPTHT